MATAAWRWRRCLHGIRPLKLFPASTAATARRVGVRCGSDVFAMEQTRLRSTLVPTVPGHVMFWKKKPVGIEFAKTFCLISDPSKVYLAIEWVHREGDIKPKLAVSDRNTPFAHIFDTHSGSNDPIMSKEIHSGPVKVMKYNQIHDVISADAKGLLEYWSPSTLKSPAKDILVLLAAVLIWRAASHCRSSRFS